MIETEKKMNLKIEYIKTLVLTNSLILKVILPNSRYQVLFLAVDKYNVYLVNEKNGIYLVVVVFFFIFHFIILKTFSYI